MCKKFCHKVWMNGRRAWRRCPWWYKYIEGFLTCYSNTSHRALLIKGKCTPTHPPPQLSFKMQWLQCMVRIAMNSMIFRLAYKECKWWIRLPTKGLNFENKEVHQCFEILRKKDGNNVWQIWTSFEDIEDMLDILANNSIKELEEDLSVVVEGIEAR